MEITVHRRTSNDIETGGGADGNGETLLITQALERDKREGLRLTIQARFLILAVLALLILTRIPWPESGYYLIFVAAFAVVGWMQLRFGNSGYQRAAVIALMFDAVILTYMMLGPNPWVDPQWPTAAIYKFSGWRYLFVFLAAATIGHSWKVVLLFGAWTGLVWLMAAFGVAQFGTFLPEISQQLKDALDSDSLAGVIDPNRIFWSARIADAIVLALVAAILAINAWRRNRLVLAQAELARQRANLSRHFAPSMVKLLANRDQPFGAVRTQTVTVIFADIVGFTSYAERVGPQAAIELLRQFHQQMEAIIFRHDGTLDKFLGDGVMASFGTPDTRPDDAQRALLCVKDMISVNLPHGLLIAVGAHRGEAVLGDVGSHRRLEFATIGDTVNVAARLEAATRDVGVRALVSEDCINGAASSDGFSYLGPHQLRGRKQAINVWQIV